MDNDLVEKLRERYPLMHPLIFQRTIERTKNCNDLFDVLETVPKFPILWEAGKWVTTKDLLQVSKFDFDDEEVEADGENT